MDPRLKLLLMHMFFYIGIAFNAGMIGYNLRRKSYNMASVSGAAVVILYLGYRTLPPMLPVIMYYLK